jgi:sugar (pentulose or hexulose) kinase
MDAQASVVGFKPDTTAHDLYQALIEATTYRYAAGWDLLRPFANDGVRIVGSGGGLAESPYWGQLVADVLGVPVTMFAGGEASSRGSAIVALRAISVWKGLSDAPPQLGVTHEPRPEHLAAHTAARERQQRLYDRLIGRQL